MVSSCDHLTRIIFGRKDRLFPYVLNANRKGEQNRRDGPSRGHGPLDWIACGPSDKHEPLDRVFVEYNIKHIRSFIV